MEEKSDTSSTAGEQQKNANPIEALSKEEIISKYKGLLSIAKKAKQAKDENAEENRKLKEALQRSEIQKDADKKALLTMQEMLEAYTENKLQLTTQLSELQKQRKLDEEHITQIRIENESLQRQLGRLSDDNEVLLTDIDRMENQLKQVNLLGIEQKKHLALLELEVNKLKESESLNASLQNQVAVTLAENKALKNEQNNMQKAVNELMEKYAHVKETNSVVRKKFNALKERFVEVLRKLTKLKECKRVLLETQHEYADAVSKWQKEIINASHMLCAQLNALKAENAVLLQQIKQDAHSESKINSVDITGITNKLNKLQHLCVIAVHEQAEIVSKLSAANEENTKLRVELEKNCEGSEIVTNENVKLKQELKQAEQKVEMLQTEVSHLKSKQHDAEQIEETTQSQMAEINQLKSELESHKIQKNHLNAENVALQAEVRALNEQLVENQQLHDELQQIRDVIKALEQEKVELLQKLKQTADKNPLEHDLMSTTQSDSTHEQLVLRYEQKEREHADLLSEMRELNEALKARGDVISRQQEKQQELVVEAKKTSTKLKQIESKLNEKDQFINEKNEEMRDLNREIELARNKVIDLEARCARNEQQVRTLTDELQSLRNTSEVTAETQSDILSTSTISRAEELSRMNDVDESFEERYNKLRGLAVKLKKKLQEQTSFVAEMEQQLSGHTALKKELEECKKHLRDLENEHSQSQQIVESLKEENQKLKTTRKQTTMLNLEMEAAEKSLAEATAKLATKSSELETLNEALTTKETTIVQLRKEMAILESDKVSEISHAKQLKEQIDRLTEQIKDAVHGKQTALIAHKELEQVCENLKLELEDVRLQMSKNASAQEVAVDTANAEKLQAEQKLLNVEQQLAHSQSMLKTADRSLEDLRIEYLNYKVKAQAVLRKNQSRDSSKESDLEEELLALRATEKQLKANAQTQQKRIEENERFIEQLQEDNASLQRRSKELHNVIDELRQQNDNLADDNRNQLLLQQEALRNHRQQIENIDACNKEQQQELETRLLRQIEQLKMDLAKTVRIAPLIGGNAIAARAPLTPQTPSIVEQNNIDLLLMEREDAEGSEEAEALASIAAKRKISTTSQRSQHNFMPLDELLNAPMNAFVSEQVTTASMLGQHFDSNATTENAHLELQSTKERLQKQETRVRHLTALLAENEQDLAKLTQMNDMLKEELRRQERGVEREKHMHNSEYLKNVVLKFLTLNNGDERSRLVPVLNTILKLSRSETEMLNCVAKGQKVTTDGNQRSWSNFLTSWGVSGGGLGSNNNNNN